MNPGVEPQDLEVSALWQAVPDGLLLADERGQILAVSNRLADLFGYDPDQLLGASISMLLPASYRAHHDNLIAGYFEEPTSRSMAAGGRLEGQRNDGTTVPVSVSLSPVVVGGRTGVLAAVRDVTDSLRSDQQLAEATRRRLLVELRERLGRDLHDTVIQELFAVGMSLQLVSPQITDPLIAERVSESIDHIDQVIRHIRDAVLGPRRHHEPDSLSEQLVAVAAELTPALGLTPQLTIASDLDARVPPEVAAHVVPVLREALANVARHAGAIDVDVCVSIDADEVVVRVFDDGVGPPATVVRPGGLANLASRAQEVGGSFELVAHRPVGSVLVWKAPLD